MKDDKGKLNLIKLRSTSNEIELSMIKEILADNGIPYIIKDHGPGGHMRIIGGSSLYGTDIMIDKTDFDRANRLLESISID